MFILKFELAALMISSLESLLPSIRLFRHNIEQLDWEKRKFSLLEGLLGRGDLLRNQCARRRLQQGCAGCHLHVQIETS